MSAGGSGGKPVSARNAPSTLGDRYARHNLLRGRGFVYGGNERVGELIRR